MTESVFREMMHETLKASLLKQLPAPSRQETAIRGLSLSHIDEEVSPRRCF